MTDTSVRKIKIYGLTAAILMLLSMISGAHILGLNISNENGTGVTVTNVSDPKSDVLEGLNEDFEGENEWTTGGLWHRVSESDQYGDSSSGAHSMWYGQDSTGDYDTGSQTSGSLVSPNVDLNDMSEAELSFKHWFKTENYQDGHYDKLMVKINGDQIYYKDTTDPNVGSEDDFVNETIDLSSYTGQTIQIEFRFDSVDDYENGYRGWYVDDVYLSTGSGSDENDEELKGSIHHLPIDPSVEEDIQFSFLPDGGNNITSYQWDFNDGTTSQKRAPMHSYETSGDHTIQVNVEDEDGDVLTSTKVVHVEEEKEELSTLLVEGFEENVEGWNTSGLWHQTSEDEEYGDSNPETGSSSMWYGQGSTGDYDTGSRTRGVLKSPEIDLNNVSRARLSFYHRYTTESYDNDFDQVKVKINDEEVYYRDSSHENVGSEDNFVKESINISEHTGQKIHIKFIFDSMDEYSNDYRGWFVDDLHLSGDKENDGNQLDLSKLQIGDIIVSRSPWKYNWLAPGKWTHTRIYIGNDTVIEPLMGEDEVVLNPAETIHDSNEAAIYRVNASSETKRKAVEFAKSKLGLPYDKTWVLKQREGDEYYCSELAWASYQTYGVNIDNHEGWHWRTMWGVAPTDVAEDDDTVRVAYDE